MAVSRSPSKPEFIMSIGKTIAEQMEHASWIRRMFEIGARMKRERGEENVFDFTLGNPDGEPPEEGDCGAAASRRQQSAPQPRLHAQCGLPGGAGGHCPATLPRKRGWLTRPITSS